MSETSPSDLGSRSRARTRRPARTAGRLVVVAGLLASPLAVPQLLPRAQAAEHAVSMQGLQFLPSEVTANVGDTVVWTSHDPDTHGVNGGGLSSPDMKNGDSWRFTISQPGDISYGCRFHPSMHGTIHVAGGGGGGGAPAPHPGGPAPAPPPGPPAPAPGGLPDIGALLAQLLGGLLGGVPHSVAAPVSAPVAASGSAPRLPLAGAAVPGPLAAPVEPRPDAAPGQGGRGSDPKPDAAPAPEPEPDLLPKLDLPKLGGLPKLPLPGGVPGLPELPALGSLLDPGSVPELFGL